MEIKRGLERTFIHAGPSAQFGPSPSKKTKKNKISLLEKKIKSTEVRSSMKNVPSVPLTAASVTTHLDLKFKRLQLNTKEGGGKRKISCREL